MTRSCGGNRSAGFSTTELIVLILVVAVIGVLAWPALSNALVKRDLTQTMNNGRELYLAAFRMATDGAAKSDASLAWPGDYPASNLADYCGKLVERAYMKPADLQRVLSAPGSVCTVATSGAPPKTTLTGRSTFKVYNVKGADPSNTIFAVSSNYTYGTALNPNVIPFGDAGFVVVHKSGDAGLFGKNQATPVGFEDSAAKFQSAIGVGKLPGAADGAVSPGDGPAVLAGP